jgi:archaellum component FlaC
MRWKGMTLSPKDLEAIRLLLREEMRNELQPFQAKVDKRFDDVFNNFDALFLRDEKREQEYVTIQEQVSRLEKRVENLEKIVA